MPVINLVVADSADGGSGDRAVDGAENGPSAGRQFLIRIHQQRLRDLTLIRVEIRVPQERAFQ